MFDSTDDRQPTQVGRAEMAGWLARLAASGVPDADANVVDEVEMLERLKSAAAARQAVLTDAFARSQRAAQQAAGTRRSELGRGVGAQIGLARHESPSKGSRHVGMAQALLADMPLTLAALQRGDTSEWRATLMVRETACLSRENRRAVDAAVGPCLAGYGDGRTEKEARRQAYRLDPAGALERTRRAEADRRVSVRPAPDTMAYLSALLPVKHAVAAYAALGRHADRCRASGDQRSRGQIMADELVARLTGAATADATDAEIVVIVSGDTLFAGPSVPVPTACRSSADSDTTVDADSGGRDAGPSATTTSASPASGLADEPGIVPGFGPVPASWVRRMARNPDARIWLRRAFAHPRDGTLIAMESRRRFFPSGLRKALIVRDQTCRTPWCDAPIRQADHVRSHHDGGPTAFDNGDGLCQACNLARQARDFTVRPVPDRDGRQTGTIEIVTPTGHSYRSHPPPLPGIRPRPERPPPADSGGLADAS